MIVGVISDTHGLLRPEALAALRGSELIIHAGDVGAPTILDELREIAPVAAVRGNIDLAPWAEQLPVTATVRAGDHTLYVIHDLGTLDANAVRSGYSIVISGHSHKAKAERREGVLYLNPGSAGPRRFKLPVTLALLRLDGESICHEIVKLCD